MVCYLGETLSVDGDADAAMETQICLGWNTFRHCLPIVISLIMRGRL